MDTLVYIAIVLAVLLALALLALAYVIVLYKKLIAFVNAAGLILTGDLKDAKPDEVLKEFIHQAEAIGQSEMGRKLIDALVKLLIPKASGALKAGLEKFDAEPWEPVPVVDKDDDEDKPDAPEEDDDDKKIEVEDKVEETVVEDKVEAKVVEKVEEPAPVVEKKVTKPKKVKKDDA